MKYFLLFSLLTLLILGCKKESTVSDDTYLETVKQGLGDSLVKVDFQNLDFSKSVLSKVDSVNIYLLRVPFQEKSIAQDFVVVKTNREGRIATGKIVHQEGSVAPFGEGIIKRRRYDGNIIISSLDRKTVMASSIENGYITAFHPAAVARAQSLEAPGMMPEIIISYTIHTGVSWSSYMMLQSFFHDSGGGSWGNYYGSLDTNLDNVVSGGGGGPIGSGGGPIGNGEVLVEDPVILIDVENQDEFPEIDIQKFIHCFNSIPDAGSTCSIEIFSDIPVDSNPNTIYDIDARSPGHTFINITKQNGIKYATQNIGFYPKSGYKSITYAPVAGKLVDNAHHEFNASYRMNLTPAKLATVLSAIQLYANANYDVDEYNCTDFALNVVNSVRGFPLAIPKYGIPGSQLTQATRTPGGLYNKLQEMVNTNDPEKVNITIGIYKGYAGGSTGPCN